MVLGIDYIAQLFHLFGFKGIKIFIANRVTKILNRILHREQSNGCLINHFDYDSRRVQPFGFGDLRT